VKNDGYIRRYIYKQESITTFDCAHSTDPSQIGSQKISNIKKERLLLFHYGHALLCLALFTRDRFWRFILTLSHR
jgi:hypothetical protein